MNETRADARRRHLRAALVALVLGGAAAMPAVAHATLWSALSGFIDLSRLDAKRQGSNEEIIRQEYNVSLSHYLTPWVDFRVTGRYYKSEQELDLLLGGYREEFQPSGELRWSHPLFLATVAGYHRELKTSAQQDLVINSFQGWVRTRDGHNYPTFELRYDQQHTYAPEVENFRDVTNQRVQASAHYDTEHHVFNYSFSHVQSENVITALSSVSDRHLFRWEGNGRVMGDTRSQISGRYVFNYGTVTSELLGTDRAFEFAPINVGLYAQDDDPLMGTLDPRGALSDGNKTDPVQPVIDIGGGNANQNIGADLGGTELIGGIYIYTDRPSGTQIRWLVYGSNDNLNWTAFPGVPIQFFNPAFNRYELTFPSGEWRYVKAVNTGVNAIALVYVTEIEVLRERPADVQESGFSVASHVLDGRIGYQLSARVHTSLDALYQREENIGMRGDRWRASAGWRLFFDQSPTTRHNLRWILARQTGDRPEPQLTDNTVGYTLTLQPMRTLRGSASVSDRLSYAENLRSQNLVTSWVEGTATLYPGLNATLGGGVSWFDDYIIEREYQTWQMRAAVDAALTGTLDLIVDYLYNETHEDGPVRVRTREITTVGVDWRIVPNLYFRGSLRHTVQRTNSWLQDYAVSFTVLPGLRLNAQYYEIETDDARVTFRRSATAYWNLGRRNSIYLRIAEVDVAGVAGATARQFQQGIRITL